MKQSFRAVLFFASALLMIIGALGYVFYILPDLHGDLIDIGVRPTVLGGTVLHLYFAAFAMIGFALIVFAAAIQTLRGLTPARIPLVIIALVYIAFGFIAFSQSHNAHHLGPLLMGVLLAAALVIPNSTVR